jgi:hypothetical protein
MAGFAACYRKNAADVCMFSITALADAIYRTPETPYASIICLLLAIRVWDRVIAISAADHGEWTMVKADFVTAILYSGFTMDAALVPQFKHPEDWPIYAVTASYVTFAIAWRRRRVA